jgi:NADPH2:quinone reductase
VQADYRCFIKQLIIQGKLKMKSSEIMQQVKLKAYGGPEQLIVENLPAFPKPGAGQVLVDVEAAGINYVDIYQRKGFYKTPSAMTPGLEGVGRILAFGEGSGNINNPLQVGQRIAWINTPGSYSTHVLIPAAEVIAIPEHFTIEQALLFQSLTAQYLVKEYRDIKPGDRVLVHSAAGGLGQLLVQWFKHLGAWVVGTTSNAVKADTAKTAGADAVIQYGSDYAFLEELLSLTNGQGVHLAIDGVGAATLVNTLKGLTRGGTAVTIGSASGVPPAIDTSLLRDQCIRLAGGSVFSYTADPTELQQRASEVIKGLQEGWLKVSKGTAYLLSQVADAHKDIESRNTHGKLYLIA